MEFVVVEHVEEESIKLALELVGETGIVLVVAKNSHIAEINPHHIDLDKAARIKLVSITCMQDFIELLSLIGNSREEITHVVVQPILDTGNNISQHCLAIALMTEMLSSLNIPCTFFEPNSNANLLRICTF